MQQPPEPGSSRAVNVEHSPLLHTVPHAIELAQNKELVDARRKFSAVLENDVLDYKHYHPAALEACIDTLQTIFGNILQYPDDEKYRKVIQFAL